MVSEKSTNGSGFPQLKIWDDRHIPYNKAYGEGAMLFAEITANPSEKGKWLQFYIHESNKGRTRTVSLCLSGRELEQLRELIASIPTSA